MDRWRGILKVPLLPNSKAHYKVAVSLCLSSSSKTLSIPSANAIFFNGDRVGGTGNPVIERLSDLQRIAEILVSKFGSSTNAWVIEASCFNGSFAVYRDFIISVNSWGEPKSYEYNPTGFPASTSTVTLLSNCLKEAKSLISGRHEKMCLAGPGVAESFSPQPKTFIVGFSKGGTVLNQLVTEMGFSAVESSEIPAMANHPLMNGGLADIQQENWVIPSSKESLLKSITEVHYVDVGLNSAGAYLTDVDVIERISKRLTQGAGEIRFVLHGTPRQWCDSSRPWIKTEKNKLLQLLKLEGQKSGGKLQVHEKLYFADKPPSLQMHFEIIENLEIS